MNASDFEYDGRSLSDYGFMICVFNGEKNGLQIENNNNIVFNKIATYDGKRNTLIHTKYEDCVQIAFDICKNPRLYDNQEMIISDNEYKALSRWLNRRCFCKLRFLSRPHIEGKKVCYYNASFNIQKIYIDGFLYGLRLNMESDKPHGYIDADDQVLSFTATDVTNETAKIFYDDSDEIGFIYPDLKITCNTTGNLTLTNDLTNCIMTINGCTANEVITVHGNAQIISSNVDSHDIYNCFNWQFFTLGNTLDNRLNHIKSTLPVEIVISYQKIVKES